MRALARKIKYGLWILNGYIGRPWSLGIPQKVTVLITYYNPVRMKHIEPQVRNILKCNFVDKVIISNHNPNVRIAERIKIKDKRLVFVNQEVNRGCGYRWLVADQFDPEYLIVVDDDIFLFPWQLATLFKHLVSEPDVPHGFTGMLQLENGQFEFHDKKNMTVDFICEVYAITRSHLKRYRELKNFVARNDALTEMIDSAADFMVISQTGNHSPKIHNVGGLFRSETFKETNVAVHKKEGFDKSVWEVGQTLNQITLKGGKQHIGATNNWEL